MLFRSRNREREGELECSSAVNEEMPVEKILEAETAVEQRTELHSDGGSAVNSVSRGEGERDTPHDRARCWGDCESSRWYADSMWCCPFK